METYKLSIMGVEVQGLWVWLNRGMDFIRWYMGGQAIRACRVWGGGSGSRFTLASTQTHGTGSRTGEGATHN